MVDRPVGVTQKSEVTALGFFSCFLSLINKICNSSTEAWAMSDQGKALRDLTTMPCAWWLSACVVFVT